KDAEQSGRTVTLTTDDMQKKKNDVKVRTTLLLSLPDEHQNDLDSMSLDDLYNHLKVYEAEVQKKSNSNSQDMAFISSSKNSSNEDDNIVCVTTASTTFPTGSVNVATISQDTGSAFIASQSNGFDKSKVECFNCHKMGHFARECRAPKSQERGRKESYRQGFKAEENSSKALIAIDGMGWDWSYMANEEDHALFANEETPTEFALMANIENNETPKKSQVKYADQYKHSNKRPKGNQRNWNNLKSYQLGPEIVLHKKPCFNCSDFSHIANDYRRRVQRETNKSQNHSYKSPSYRSAGHRPNSAPMRPPLRSSGPRPHGDSMRPSFRPTGHRPHGPSMNPRRPTMNGARPYKSFLRAPSY
nr:hypothetical protein [Tanacetum cinerariifolium]